MNGDGVFGDATGVNPTLTWAQSQALGIDDGPACPAHFSVSVRVDDGHGRLVTSPATDLALSNTAPTAAVSGPGAGVRGQALFWLAQKAGQQAVAAISGAIENDPETEVKKKAVFALSQLPKDEGVPLLIQVARTNRNAEVRKQAMFWLGQSNDPRAIKFFEDVLLK